MDMIPYIYNVYVLISGVLIWSIATGLREGFTWGSNRILPLLNYHGWRMVEQLGILLMIYGTAGPRAALFYLGVNWSLVFTVYEPFLDWQMTRRWVFFKRDNPYEGINMGRPFQLVITFTGVGMILASIWWR